MGRLDAAVREHGGVLLITADHGNADDMLQKDGTTPKTSHSLNRVPLHVYAPGTQLALDEAVAAPGLANLASSLLQLMGYAAPDAFERSLFV